MIYAPRRYGPSRIAGLLLAGFTWGFVIAGAVAAALAVGLVSGLRAP